VTIRKVKRETEQLGSLSLFMQLDEVGSDGTVDDARRQARFLKKVSRGLTASLASKARLHGWHVQAMFAAMVLALGSVRLLTTEDEGECYFEDDEGPIKIPDFRLVTDTDEQLLVEVKGVAPKDAQKPQKIAASELAGMARYAEWTRARLVIAHYWSSPNLWTLVDASVLSRAGDKPLITLPDAIGASELGMLGDKMVGTTPPLVLTLFPDPADPLPTVNAAGTSSIDFRVGGTEVSCAGRAIENKVEKSIAMGLMFLGGWESSEIPRVTADGQLTQVDYEFRPAEPDPIEQRFSMLAPLSSMYSTLYSLSTLTEEGGFKTLRREPEPGRLRDIIPRDYWDEPNRSLPLWVFRLQPNAIS